MVGLRKPNGGWIRSRTVAGKLQLHMWLRHNGVAAPLMLDGAMEGPHFSANIEQILAPSLKRAISYSWRMLALTWSMGSRKVLRPAAHEFSASNVSLNTYGVRETGCHLVEGN
jgi:hypothetical protein